LLGLDPSIQWALGSEAEGGKNGNPLPRGRGRIPRIIFNRRKRIDG
jgi:hypothetical protein